MRKLVALLVVAIAANNAHGQTPPQSEPAPGASEARAAKETMSIGEATVRLRKKRTELRALQAEIENLMSAAGEQPQQMLISVKMLKISRTRLEKLGYDISEGGAAGLLNRDDGSAPAAKREPGGEESGAAEPAAARSVIIQSRSRANALLDSWKKQRIVVQEFGEQTVATVSGRPAFMHVGGEFPIVVPANQGAFTIQMKKFGRQLDVVPQLLDSGRVRLEIRPRVSEIDEARSIKINDVAVPGLRVYEIDAAVELAPGETVAVSGASQVDEPRPNQPPQAPRDEALEQFELLVLAKVELVDEMTPLENANGAAASSEMPR